jgi:hypothetical protein
MSAEGSRPTWATRACSTSPHRAIGSTLKIDDTENSFSLARELQQPIYSQREAAQDVDAVLQLHIPLSNGPRFSGVLLAEYSVDGLFRYSVPTEVTAKYAVSFHDANGGLLAGTSVPPRNPATHLLPWASPALVYEVPVSPVGNGCGCGPRPTEPHWA